MQSPTPQEPSGAPRRISLVPERPRVVVIGGGFAGLQAARQMAGTPAQVTVIDRQNYHLFQPLLYQVATAVLSPADIARPIRRILRDQRNADVLLGEVEDVDVERRVVHVGGTRVRYDYLVVATGATHSYFGHDEWERSAPGLKTVNDALSIRRRVLLAFERAELEKDPDAQAADLTFVVVGAGPTGVELAGALKEIAVRSIPQEFRHVNTASARVVLVEGLDRVLPTMSPESSARALHDLREMGVEVHLETLVTEVTEHGVRLGKGGDFLEARNVFWAAGVRGTSIAARLGAPLDRAGRVQVAPDLTVPGRPEIFVIGDLATLNDPRSGQPVPGVAPAAMQMGRYVGRRLHEEIVGSRRPADRPPFHYVDKGTMATIGRARAVADVKGLHFGGLFAWLLWSLVHIAYLVGFRNRTFVLLSWAWNYAVFSKGARLIVGPQEAPGAALPEETTRPRRAALG